MPSAKHSTWHIIGAHLVPPSALISFSSDFFLFHTYRFLLPIRIQSSLFSSSDFKFPDNPVPKQPHPALLHHCPAQLLFIFWSFKISLSLWHYLVFICLAFALWPSSHFCTRMWALQKQRLCLLSLLPQPRMNEGALDIFLRLMGWN